MKFRLNDGKLPIPSNKGRLIGQEAPLKPKEIWALPHTPSTA